MWFRDTFEFTATVGTTRFDGGMLLRRRIFEVMDVTGDVQIPSARGFVALDQFVAAKGVRFGIGILEPWTLRGSGLFAGVPE